MASKAIDLLMLDVWSVTVEMDKNNCHSLHVLLLISPDLSALPFESSGRLTEKGKMAAATFQALDIVPAESHQVKECRVLIHDGIKV